MAKSKIRPKPTQTLHSFTDLPTEIRDVIWQLVSADETPRFYDCKRIVPEQRLHASSIAKPTKLLRVCPDSRRFALLHNFIVDRPCGHRWRDMFVNPTLDTFCFAGVSQYQALQSKLCLELYPDPIDPELRDLIRTMRPVRLQQKHWDIKVRHIAIWEGGQGHRGKDLEDPTFVYEIFGHLTNLKTLYLLELPVLVQLRKDDRSTEPKMKQLQSAYKQLWGENCPLIVFDVRQEIRNAQAIYVGAWNGPKLWGGIRRD